MLMVVTAPALENHLAIAITQPGPEKRKRLIQLARFPTVIIENKRWPDYLMVKKRKY